MEATAPEPRAIQSTATRVTSGFFRRTRRANRQSAAKLASIDFSASLVRKTGGHFGCRGHKVSPAYRRSISVDLALTDRPLRPLTRARNRWQLTWRDRIIA